MEPCTLAELAPGRPARVVSVGDGTADRVAVQGIHPGALVSVEHDAPFGGPRIVRLGAARMALARSIAASILVRPEPV
jgi:Fe2+ transport system protein FeoA